MVKNFANNQLIYSKLSPNPNPGINQIMIYKHFPFLVSLFLPTTISASTFVEIQTSKGTITVELYEQADTINDDGIKELSTTNNFLEYVNENFYDDTIFHRVVDNFVIQGGGINSKAATDPGTFKPTPRDPIVLQDHPKQGQEEQDTTKFNNDYGTIAMARLNSPDSAKAQFFINTNPNDNNALNYAKPTTSTVATTRGYAVFGKVINGLTPLPEPETTSDGTPKKIEPTFDDIELQESEYTVNIINATPSTESRPTGEISIDYIRQIQIPLAFHLKGGAIYSAGDIIKATIKELEVERQSPVDLWVAIQIPNGELIYVLPGTTGQFTSIPTPLKQNIQLNENSFPVLNFTVPAGIEGDYIFYALFSEPNASINTLLTSSLRSNLADVSIKLKLKPEENSTQ